VRQRLAEFEAEQESEDAEDSPSEDEDEDGAALTDDLDRQIHATLLAIKKKDPSIYQNDVTFFQAPSDDADNAAANTDISKKPLRVSEYLAKQLLSGDAMHDDDDSDDAEDDQPKGYNAELDALKSAFLAAAEGDDDQDDDFLQYRDGTKMERKKTKAVSKVRDDPAIRRMMEEAEVTDSTFLKDFMSKKIWRATDSAALPAYKELEVQDELEHPDISEDEDELDKVDRFEANFNFRFQGNSNIFLLSVMHVFKCIIFDILTTDENAAKIVTHSRDQTTSLRKVDDSRKKERERKKENQLASKKKKEEEIKRLKNLKKHDIVKKLQTIQSITGNTTVGFGEVDLEADFDPAEWDKRMSEVFNDEYYNDDEADTSKPTFGFVAEIDDDGEAIVPPAATGDQQMDEESVKARLQARAAQDEKVRAKAAMNKQLEDLYKLDFEDIVGGQPMRFEYVQVKPDSFGLSVDDILNLDDKALNQRISLKKLAPYEDGQQEDDEENGGVSRKQRRQMLKQQKYQMKRLAGAIGPGESQSKTESHQNHAPKPAQPLQQQPQTQWQKTKQMDKSRALPPKSTPAQAVAPQTAQPIEDHSNENNDEQQDGQHATLSAAQRRRMRRKRIANQLNDVSEEPAQKHRRQEE
jgi:protein KRI1